MTQKTETDVVEILARAMCSAHDPEDVSGGPHPSGTWLDEGEAWWTGYTDQVTAALTALSEAVDQEWKAAQAKYPDAWDAIHEEFSVRVRKMLAAVKSK